MKKNANVPLTIAALALMLAPGMAFAQVSVEAGASVDAGSRQGERREAFQQGREERRAELDLRIEAAKERGAEARARFASTSADVKARIETNVKERVQAHAGRIHANLSAAFGRLAAFEAKVEARLDELASAGVDVSLSREELETATAVRVSGEANIADLKADLDAGLAAETSREEVVALMRAAREELARVRQAYAEVLIQVRADVKASKEQGA
ncbi:MAG: hypothetical protein V4644_03725 [Patescibacteria group bacterium]